MKFPIVVLLLSLLGSAFAEETCDAEPQDDRVYKFAFGPDWMPYMDINEDGEIFGFTYNVINAVCKIMNKKCRPIGIYNWDFCWDDSKHSLGLYNGWFDACVGYSLDRDRLSAVGFVMEYSHRPASYMYVKRRSSINTVDEIRSSSTVIGVVEGSKQSAYCIEKYLGRDMAGRINDRYSSNEDMADALDDGDIDVMFVRAEFAEGDNRFERVYTDPINCYMSGYQLMARKDTVLDLAWMDEGFQKIRDNGDYDWFCNHVDWAGEPGCL